MNDENIPEEKYIVTHKKELIIGVAISVGVIATIIAMVLSIAASTPKVVYQPTKACDLLTIEESKDLLGEKTLQSGEKTPAQSGNTASSQCGYTDGNPDTDSMLVAAVVVRSGVNDKGVEQNKTEFTAGKPDQGVEDVKGVGDQAYYNQKLGQLNILDGRNWIILSYGPGASPEENTLDNSLKMAQKVITSTASVSNF